MEYREKKYENLFLTYMYQSFEEVTKWWVPTFYNIAKIQ